MSAYREEVDGNGRVDQESVAERDEATSSPHEEARMGVDVCPHFALPDDPDTSLLFPSAVAHCHRAKPAAPVQFPHQERFCLTGHHRQCPVFHRRPEEEAPLPDTIRARAPLVPGSERGWARLLAVAILAAMVFLAIGWGFDFIPADTEEEPLPTRDSVAIQPALNTETPTPLATATTTMTPAAQEAVPVVPSPSPSPSLTSTPLPSATAVATAPVTATGTVTVSLTVTATSTPTATTPVSTVTAVITTPLELRAGPHASYPVLQTLDEIGAAFEAVGLVEDGSWVQLCCVENDTSGWALAGSVQLQEPDQIPIVSTPAPSAMVVVNRVNARTGPGLAYPIITLIEEGREIPVVGRLNDGLWWQICCVEGRESPLWVYGETVALRGDVDDLPVAPVPPIPTPTPTP